MEKFIPCCNNPNYETKTNKKGKHYRVCLNCNNLKFGAVDKALETALNIIFTKEKKNDKLRII